MKCVVCKTKEATKFYRQTFNYCDDCHIDMVKIFFKPEGEQEPEIEEVEVVEQAEVVEEADEIMDLDLDI